jgi:hypothetical protein
MVGQVGSAGDVGSPGFVWQVGFEADVGRAGRLRGCRVIRPVAIDRRLMVDVDTVML